MRPKPYTVWLAVVMVLNIDVTMVLAENIDPFNNSSQYAYSENAGWMNAEPQGDGGPGAEVGDTQLTGYIWAENIGWINLSCVNTSSCSSVDFGVINDGFGNLSGFAWTENVGWISFSCESTGNCDPISVQYGVMIDPLTGELSGRAWGENIGWVTFRDDTPVAYGVTTAWSAAISSCQGDFPPADGDVDGEDLSEYASDSAIISLNDFATEFGRIDCF